MTVDDLNWHTETYQGDAVDFFELNARYHGYSNDVGTHDMIHVYDENTTGYTSYTKDEMNGLLAQNYFGDPGPGNTEIVNVWNQNGMNNQDTSNPSSSWVKPVFLVLAGVMIIYIATGKEKK